MWLLSWVPDAFLEYLVNTTLILGVIGTFLSFFVINRILRWFPVFANYFHIAQFISVVVLLAGVYFKGSFQTEADWRAKVAEAQANVDRAEEESKQANAKLETVRKQKQKVRTEYITTVKERIVEKEKLIDAKCELDPSVAQILNDAAKNTSKKGTVTIEVNK
jgi:hypothetical protein